MTCGSQEGAGKCPPEEFRSVLLDHDRRLEIESGRQVEILVICPGIAVGHPCSHPR